MTQTEAFEAKLSTHSDAVCLVGKQFFSSQAITSLTPSILLQLDPTLGFFGTRPANMSAIFNRFRFKYLKLKFLSNSSTGVPTSSIASLGIQDDISLTGLVPTTFADVAELRCSATSFSGQTVPTQWQYVPLDKKRWYYVNNDSTEPRQSSQGTLWVAASGVSVANPTTVAIELDYSIVFAGATNIAVN
jgi:hypothetical protein